MQEEPTRTDLSEIDDENQLNSLYVECSETIVNIQDRLELERENMKAIRGRISQLRNERLNSIQNAPQVVEDNKAE